MLADRPTGAGLPLRKFVGEWLREYLQNGSQTQGTSRSPLRVKASASPPFVAPIDLGVRSIRDGVKGVWCWSLPPAVSSNADKEARCSNN